MASCSGKDAERPRAGHRFRFLSATSRRSGDLAQRSELPSPIKNTYGSDSDKEETWQCAGALAHCWNISWLFQAFYVMSHRLDVFVRQSAHGFLMWRLFAFFALAQQHDNVVLTELGRL